TAARRARPSKLYSCTRLHKKPTTREPSSSTHPRAIRESPTCMLGLSTHKRFQLSTVGASQPTDRVKFATDSRSSNSTSRTRATNIYHSEAGTLYKLPRRHAGSSYGPGKDRVATSSTHSDCRHSLALDWSVHRRKVYRERLAVSARSRPRVAF